MNFTYLIIDISSIIFPLLFSFHPRLNFHKTWNYFWPANIMSAAIFICWDMYYTNLGVWGFNPQYITGSYLENLPLEEILFFICIPYASVFTYHCIGIYNKEFISIATAKLISIVLISLLVIIGIYSYPKLYTSVTFLALAVFLFFLLHRFKSKMAWQVLCFLPHHTSSFFCC